MSRQQRRAEERARAKRESRKEVFDRLHGKILEAKTIRHMWDVWRQNNPVLKSMDTLPEDLKAVADLMVRDTFYAGAGSMLEMMERVGPDEVSYEQGVEMLQRWHEELQTYLERKKSHDQSGPS